MPSPPGGGRHTDPVRASNGPANRMDVRIFRARTGSRRTFFRRFAVIVAVCALRSRVTFAPKHAANSNMRRTSAMSGTFSSVTASSERSAAAIIGSAAFLLPGTR